MLTYADCHWRKQHRQKVAALSRTQRDGLKKDGYYDYSSDEWPKVLPFLVGGYKLESSQKSKSREKKKAGNSSGEMKKRAVKDSIEQVNADFIHSIRTLIKGCTDPEEFKDANCEWDPLPACMIVCDRDDNTAVPFCRHLPIAPSVSHRSGVAVVHLIDKKVDFKKHNQDVGAGKHANTGRNESKLAKVVNSCTQVP